MPALAYAIGLMTKGSANSSAASPGTMDFSKPAESGLIILLEDI